MSKYSILKGTVSRLTVFNDNKEMRADNIGLIAFIGLTIMDLIGSAATLIGSLTSGSVKLNGQGFFCYVGSQWVEGRLEQVPFNDGDYVEMVVKSQKQNCYTAYAVRLPQQHALFFPRSVGTPTLVLLKYCAIIIGVVNLFIYPFLLLVSFLNNDFWGELIGLSITSCIVFLGLTIALFFMLDGYYSFLSNKIYSTLGYPKSWLFDGDKEQREFKKMNRSQDPVLFDDPQTPDFKKVTKYNPFAQYYVRTPVLPNWVKVIDERGLSSKQASKIIIIEDHVE